jgi:nicotinamide phosphoribosyltransferase
MGKEGEAKLFGDLLRKYPTGILSVVIDSYDYRNFITSIASMYRDAILAREGKVVFRPDSGDPDSVTLEVFRGLGEVFGTTKNDKGYKELNPKVGVLWGDGIDYDGIRGILFTLRNNGYSTNPMVFGMGGGLLQKINRDTQRFAFKSSAQCRNGTWFDIFKNPLDSTKVSKKGKLALIKNNKGEFETPSLIYQVSSQYVNLLETVFLNGEIKKEYKFDEVRSNVGNW